MTWYILQGEMKNGEQLWLVFRPKRDQRINESCLSHQLKNHKSDQIISVIRERTHSWTAGQGEGRRLIGSAISFRSL
jgi:hypothetical protein